MDILQEIFKNNTKLLDEPEVKELIEFSRMQYDIVKKHAVELNRFLNFTLEQCMYSEVVSKKGNSCKKTVKSILDYIEKMD